MMHIPAFTNPYSGLPPGGGGTANWNSENLSLPSLQYANNGKPGLQQWFIARKDSEGGNIHLPGAYNSTTGVWSTPAAWTLFLNYYLWLQSCVDYQVGRVLGTNPSNNSGLAQSPFANNTIVIFTSDHGDYAGSHGMHAKGGGLYEEAINVPLYISYPQMRNNGSLTTPTVLPYVCSSVDLLPYIYTVALGNAQWRGNNNDTIYHLASREAIEDAIFRYQNNSSNTAIVPERRLSSLPLYQPVAGCSPSCANWQTNQPFVLHTADDYVIANLGSSNYQPSHALAFRTVDITDQNNNSASFYGQNVYGGGKLGIYSFWDTCGQNQAPIKQSSNTSAIQYEFYNYSTHPAATPHLTPNLQELANQYNNTSNGNPSNQAQQYLNDFNNASSPTGINIQTELYTLNQGTSSGNMPTQQVVKAIQVAFQNYRNYLINTNQITDANGRNNTC